MTHTPSSFRRLLLTICLSLFVTLHAFPHTALAQEKLPNIEDLKPEAQNRLLKHLDSGRVYYENGKFDQGLEEFQKAYALFPHPDVLYRVAECQEKLGQDAAAIASYKKFLRQVPKAKERNRIKGIVAVLEKRLEKRQQASLSINTVPSGAQVILNGKPHGATPLEVPVSPGTYQIILRRQGYQPVEQTLRIGQGKSLVLRFPLQKIQAKDSNNIASKNNKKSNNQQDNNKKSNNSQNNTVVKTNNTQNNITEEPLPAQTNMTPWIVTGAGSVTLLMAGVFWIIHSDAAGEVNRLDAQKQERRRPENYNDLVATRNNFGTLAVITTVVSVGALTTGAILWAMGDSETADRKKDESALSIIPVWTPEHVGLGFHSRF